MSPARSALAAVLLTGCAQNAVLEVEMDLPGSAGARYAVVEVRPATEAWPFAEPWGTDTTAFPLDADACAETESTLEVCNVRFSVVSSDPSLAAIRIRARLCADAECGALPGDDSAPQYRFELERPFYVGRVTRWSPSLPPYLSVTRDSAPPDPDGAFRLDVGRCEIEGCSTGTRPSGESGWCLTDGAHFCD